LRTGNERAADRHADVVSDLGQLAQENQACAGLVKLRFFAGLTQEQAAACLGI
jgi:hypothetical protein